MAFEFRPPVRAGAPLLIGLAGGTGSGKTMSALRLARGLAGGQPFAFIDTENGRALHYADYFPDMRHALLAAPFTPSRYTDAVLAADQQGFPVIVVDSASHEWEGEGGILEMQVAEFKKLGSRDTVKMLSWAEPKSQHKAFVRKLLQTRAHVILCFRAEDKIDMVKDSQGKTQVVPKESLVGHDGWIPICEKRLPFEMTLSLLFTADKKGIPQVIKLEGHHEPFVPLDRQLGEDTGKALAAWAAGGNTLAPEEPASVAVSAGTGAEQSLFAPPAGAVELAGKAKPPAGVEGVTAEAADMTLEQILALGDKGITWLRWASETAGDRWPEDFKANLDVFVAARLPKAVAA